MRGAAAQANWQTYTSWSANSLLQPEGTDQTRANSLLRLTSQPNPSMLTHLACIVKDKICLVDGSRLGVDECEGATSIGAARVEGAAEDADKSVVLEQGSPLLQTRGRHFGCNALTDKYFWARLILAADLRKRSMPCAWQLPYHCCARNLPVHLCGVLSQIQRHSTMSSTISFDIAAGSRGHH